jgi:hypothetical protein
MHTLLPVRLHCGTHDPPQLIEKYYSGPAVAEIIRRQVKRISFEQLTGIRMVRTHSLGQSLLMRFGREGVTLRLWLGLASQWAFAGVCCFMAACLPE